MPHSSRKFAVWFKKHASTGRQISTGEFNHIMRQYTKSGAPLAKTAEEQRRAYNLFAKHYRNFLDPLFSKIEANFALENGNFKENGKVLCLGSGICYLENYLAKFVVPKGTVTAVDVSEKMLDEGRQIADIEGIKNIEFSRSSIEGYRPQSGFNTVLSYGVPFWDASMIEKQLMIARAALEPSPKSRFIFQAQLNGINHIEIVKQLFMAHGFELINLQKVRLPDLRQAVFFCAKPKNYN